MHAWAAAQVGGVSGAAGYQIAQCGIGRSSLSATSVQSDDDEQQQQQQKQELLREKREQLRAAFLAVPILPEEEEARALTLTLNLTLTLT